MRSGPQGSSTRGRTMALVQDVWSQSEEPETTLSLHMATKAVSWSDGLASLTKTEFAIVEYLARRGNYFVPHTELLDVVLGAHWSYDASVVRVHLLRIRKKLGASGNVLVTTPGRDATRLAVVSVTWC